MESRLQRQVYLILKITFLKTIPPYFLKLLTFKIYACWYSRLISQENFFFPQWHLNLLELSLISSLFPHPLRIFLRHWGYTVFVESNQIKVYHCPGLRVLLCALLVSLSYLYTCIYIFLGFTNNIFKVNSHIIFKIA